MAQNGTPLPETTVVCTVRLTNNNNSCFVKITNKKTHTFSVSNHQHSVVDHPGAAENLQRVRNTLSVELQFDKGNKNVMTTVSRISCWFSHYWSEWWCNDETQTCMAKAFRATETGPFSASQAAISVKKANNETVFIIPFHWTNAYTSQKKTKQQPSTEPSLPPASAQHTHPSRLWAAPRRSWCRRPPCWCWSRSSACGRCRSSRSLTPDHLGKHRKCKQRWMELECRFSSTEVRGCFSWTDDRFFLFCFILYNLNFIAYRASLWLRRHLTAALLCTPDRVRRSRRALKKQINRIKSYVGVYPQLWTAMSVLRRTAAEVFHHLVQTGTAASRFSETTVPRCCPSPRRPSKTHTCPCKTQTHSKHKELLIKTWHVTCCVVIFVCRWLLVPGSSQNWRHRDPSNPSWRGRGPWRERQVSLACGESTDSAGGSGTWSEILPLVEILKRRKDKSQRWFKGMFLGRSWCKTCKLKDVDPHLKLCNTQTHTRTS